MIQEKQLFRIRGDTGSGACAGGDQGEEDTQIGEASASHGHYSAWSWLVRLTQHFSVHAFVRWRESLKKTCLDTSANFITLPLPLLLHISVSPSSSFRHRVIYGAALPMEAAELQGQNGDLFAKQSSKLLIRLNKNFRNLCFQNHQGIKQMKCQIELFIHKFL